MTAKSNKLGFDWKRLFTREPIELVGLGLETSTVKNRPFCKANNVNF